jgi:hypothetical protein
MQFGILLLQFGILPLQFGILPLHSVENRQKNGILPEIGESHILPQKWFYPTPDTLKVGLTPKFDHSSRCRVRNQATKLKIFKKKI